PGGPGPPRPQAVQRPGRAGRPPGHRLPRGPGRRADRADRDPGRGRHPGLHGPRAGPGFPGGHAGQRRVLAGSHPALRGHRARALSGRHRHGRAGQAVFRGPGSVRAAGRPRSPALVAGRGSFMESSAGPDDGHSYLPESAMGLIGSYARSPQPGVIDTSPDDVSSDEMTSASPTPLTPSSVPGSPRRRKAGQEAKNGLTKTALTKTATARPGTAPPTRTGSGLGDRRVRIGLIAGACVVAAAALVAAGAFLGPQVDPSLRGSTTSAGGYGPPPAPPPSTLPTRTRTTPKTPTSHDQ